MDFRPLKSAELVPTDVKPDTHYEAHLASLPNNRHWPWISSMSDKWMESVVTTDRWFYPCRMNGWISSIGWRVNTAYLLSAHGSFPEKLPLICFQIQFAKDICYRSLSAVSAVSAAKGTIFLAPWRNKVCMASCFYIISDIWFLFAWRWLIFLLRIVMCCLSKIIWSFCVRLLNEVDADSIIQYFHLELDGHVTFV